MLLPFVQNGLDRDAQQLRVLVVDGDIVDDEVPVRVVPAAGDQLVVERQHRLPGASCTATTHEGLLKVKMSMVNLFGPCLPVP